MSTKDNSGLARIRQGPHARALALLGERLSEAGIAERELLAWLKDREAVSARVFALRSIPTRRLEILLQEWESVREQLL
jgi:hypothetical protein